MGIEDIQISEELETNAPSIKYSGNEGPKSPQEQQQMMMAQLEEEYKKYVEEMIEMEREDSIISIQQFIKQAMAEGQMSGGNPLPNDPTKPINPFAPKPTGPTLPDRQMAAYGGIMGLDGRKKYGVGSWFQENIMDPIKENPELAAAAVLYGVDTLGIPGTEIGGDKYVNRTLGSIYDYVTDDPDGSKGEKKSILGNVGSALTENLVPIIGGLTAGLFSDRDQPGGQSGMPSDNTAIQLADLKKSANILDQKQGMAAGLNFLPSVAARKYTPAEMIETYSQAAANGGRIGYKEGGSVMTLMDGTKVQIPDGAYENGTFKDIIYSSDRGSLLREEVIRGLSFSQGGRIGRAEGGIMDLGGMEKDYRAEGGFVPIGREEKADDVPARLSVNEFVFTADAVRSAGGGDIDQGAKVMENMMKHLEAGGQVSEESQGLGGAREMFETSQRLGDVI
jgi:hypothetical protein